jgi:hypothetical protein
MSHEYYNNASFPEPVRKQAWVRFSKWELIFVLSGILMPIVHNWYWNTSDRYQIPNCIRKKIVSRRIPVTSDACARLATLASILIIKLMFLKAN